MKEFKWSLELSDVIPDRKKSYKSSFDTLLNLDPCKSFHNLVIRNAIRVTNKTIMSDSNSSSSSSEAGSPPPRAMKKRTADEAELEIDLNAPEPPSKKALRKAKKIKEEKSSTDDGTSTMDKDKKSSASKVPKEDINNSGKRSEYGIWIGNLSFTTTREELFQFMSSDPVHPIPKEKVTRVNLPGGRPRNGKPQNKGFAYIDLADAESHGRALELSEKLLSGRRVLIKDSKSFEGRPKEGTKETSSHPASKRIFLGNLGFDTAIEDLESHFGVCGPISNTHMATFEDSGKCKGYAWLEFEQLSSAQAAMRGWIEEGTRRIWLHNMDGRKLRLEYAEDKATRYQKRYGKDAQKGENNAPPIEEVSTERPDNTDQQAPQRPVQARERKERKLKVRENGYAADTVQRLTGAIVAAQGSKKTFD